MAAKDVNSDALHRVFSLSFMCVRARVLVCGMGWREANSVYIDGVSR